MSLNNYPTELDLLNERFQRPSKQLALSTPYNLSYFEQYPNYIFQNPDQVIIAYFGVLKQAANMTTYTCGCGSIGDTKQPYPYAYELFTKEYQKVHTYNEFLDSFLGIGHISFLKIYEAYSSPSTPNDMKYYLIEYEIISEQNIPNSNSEEPMNTKNKTCNFSYYYGIATVQYSSDNGWKISDINTLREDFLCAPFHSWFYQSESIIQLIYVDALHIVEQIDDTVIINDTLSIYASGHNQKYRFDFVRLTNGYDILLHEYILINNSWMEGNFLGKQWSSLKFSIDNFIS
ncbi:hypothetical protein [Anaeromicropila herbilytica]|uniref:Uncharacterized protein n=1 Tax=Anaeromicropila herbilytica TaxID=2785025 RepID=A0A7R7EJS0_9FIRM|nr:hypothetical protein [Anaeromicropila herbilytica]BCN30415.1 hypothetical protein bsdtb5_17100 [Anaeromicropila herbilytica]